MLTESIQAQFHARWSELSDPHVRALAWLITSPNLLDSQDARWQGKVATLVPEFNTEQWLGSLDRDPAALHAYLRLGPFERLGRYAEKLLAFYFQHCGQLLAHGVQVHNDAGQTIGEFDFLLRESELALHWEFAIKLYLMGSRDGDDCFVGPNLADTLQTKMRKILDHQLALGLHSAAQAYLPTQIVRAQALIKGWMFYRVDEPAEVDAGLSAEHCRGFWYTHTEAQTLHAACYVLLPRLSWLAPAQVSADEALGQGSFLSALAHHFLNDTTPVLIAQCAVVNGHAQEISRGFIVPDDWRERAGQRTQRAVVMPG